MRVGMENFIARAADTMTRRQGRSLASVGSSSVCKRGKIEDVDNSRVRAVCGQLCPQSRPVPGLLKLGHVRGCVLVVTVPVSAD